MFDLGIAELVDDLDEHDRVIRAHRTGWVNLVLAVALDNDSIAVEPQPAMGLTQGPVRYAVTRLKDPSILEHCELFLGVPWHLSAAELRTTRSSRTGSARTAVLVPEDEATLIEIIWRHLNCDAVAGESLDTVLLHFASSIGDDFVTALKPHAIASVRKDLYNLALECDQFFFSHCENLR